MSDRRGGSERAGNRGAGCATPGVEVVDCDPALADTAAFCAAYGYAPEDSANAIVVVGRASRRCT